MHFSNGRINVYHNKLKPEITFFFDNKQRFEVGELFNQKMLLLYSMYVLLGQPTYQTETDENEKYNIRTGCSQSTLLPGNSDLFSRISFGKLTTPSPWLVHFFRSGKNPQEPNLQH